MPKQLQWAIGGLALLIVGFVALQIYLSVDMKRFKEELAGPEPKTETETEQPPEQVQVPEVDKRPSQKNGHSQANGTFDEERAQRSETSKTQEVPVEQVSTPQKHKGHSRVGSDYPLLIETENPVVGKGIFLRTIDGTGIDIDWETLSPAELAEKIRQAEREELPLPDGYYYRCFSDGALLKDERGFPILHKKGEPFISVIWEIEFKPSPEQFEEYMELYRWSNKLWVDNPDSPEYNTVKAELDEMEQTYVGPLPTVFQVSGAAQPGEFEAQQARASALTHTLQIEMFKQLNLEYLLEIY